MPKRTHVSVESRDDTGGNSGGRERPKWKSKEKPKRRKRRDIHDFGKFQAEGVAAVVKLEEHEIRDIVWKDLRVFFVPDSGEFHKLRVLPAITKIYGPEMKVFAIPPAPSSWVQEMNKRTEIEYNKDKEPPENLKLHLQIYLEEFQSGILHPYGKIVYLFANPKSKLPLRAVPVPAQVAPSPELLADLLLKLEAATAAASTVLSLACLCTLGGNHLIND